MLDILHVSENGDSHVILWKAPNPSLYPKNQAYT
jgi:hypothetical protein